MNLTEVSRKNSEFWNELCGTSLAKSLGIMDASKDSLKKFDDWYFDFYPYLSSHIPFHEIAGRDVLEIGLGYGTVSQRLAEAGARYTGLDIAEGPVAMANHRLSQAGLPGKALQGSILSPTFSAESFDLIVAIGCLHHSGDLQLALKQCWKLLRSGGKLIFMVYHAYSYRRFLAAPGATISTLSREMCGYRGVVGSSEARERAAYDAGSNGDAAPHTDWISIWSLRHLCNEFANFSAQLENIGADAPFHRIPRAQILKTRWPHIIGLDVYATATK